MLADLIPFAGNANEVISADELGNKPARVDVGDNATSTFSRKAIASGMIRFESFCDYRNRK